jgi:erythromycin esterase-like protein
MPTPFTPAARTAAHARRGAARVIRCLHDEQGFRDLCAEAAPLRCRT